MSTANARLALELLRWSASRSGPGPGECDPDTRAFLRAREIDSLLTLARDERDRWQEAYDLVWRHQMAVLREALGALVAEGVRPLTFKGGELIWRHYGDRSLGFVGDVDVLVPRDQLETTKAALYQLGFRHASFDQELNRMRDRDVRDIAQIELHHYELAPFTKAVALNANPTLVEIAGQRRRNPLHLGPDGPLMVLEIDVHHNVASDADPIGLFERAVPSSVGIGETFSPGDHVWFNLTRYYNEVALHDKTSLRPLAYTLPQVASGQVDWDVVEKASTDLALGPTLWYFLALCERLVPGSVPPPTLDAVAHSTTSRVRDWGWQLGKLFGFREEFPAYAFA